MTGRVKAGAMFAAGVLGAGAAIAFASVPDSNGVVHACYELAPGGGTVPASGPNVRVIDTNSAQACDAASERAFTISGQPGPQGIQGPPGVQGPPGAEGTVEVPGPDPTGGKASLTFACGRTRALGGTTVQFDVLSVGYRVSGGAGHAAGYQTKNSPPPVVIVTRTPDKFSPALMKACISGQHFPKVVLHLGSVETLTLTTAYIIAIQPSGSGGAQVHETLQFVAEKITTEYSGGTKSGPLPALKYNAKTQLKL